MALEACPPAIVVHVQLRHNDLGLETISKSSAIWSGQLWSSVKSSGMIGSPTTLREPNSAMIPENSHGRATKLIAGFYVVPESIPPVSRTRTTYHADENDGKRVTVPADVSSVGVPAVAEQSQPFGRARNYRASEGQKPGGAVVRNEDQAPLNMHDHLQILRNRNVESAVDHASRWFNAGSACFKGYCPDNASLSHQCNATSKAHASNATSKAHASNECKFCWPQQNDTAIHEHCTITAGRLNLSLLAAFSALLLMILVILVLLRRRILRYCQGRTRDINKQRKTRSGSRGLRKWGRRAEKATGSAELPHQGQASLRQRNASLPPDEEKVRKAAAAPESV